MAGRRPVDDIEARMVGAPLEVTDLKRFVLRKRLRQTLQGYVWLAFDTETKTQCVVKQAIRSLIIRGVSHEGGRVGEDFPAEIRMHARLAAIAQTSETAPDILNVYGWWLDATNLYMAMEFCAGGELFDYIQASGSRDALARDIQRSARMRQQYRTRASRTAWIKHVQSLWQQLVREVAFMHEQGVAHRDLSLENSMLADRAMTIAKTIDFGLAKTFDVDSDTAEDDTAMESSSKPTLAAEKAKRSSAASRSHMMLGSVGKRGYMSPETLQGQRRPYDARANDIWCLGIMLFMMLVGAPPFPEAKFARRGDRPGTFDYVMGGHMAAVLKQWKRLPLVTDEAIDVLNKIFRVESKRITMTDLLDHPFMRPDEDERRASERASAAAATRVDTSSKSAAAATSSAAESTSESAVVSPSASASSPSTTVADRDTSDVVMTSSSTTSAAPSRDEGEESPPGMRSPTAESTRRDSRSIRTEHRRQESDDGMVGGDRPTPGGGGLEEDVDMKQSYTTEEGKHFKSKLESVKNDDALQALLEDVQKRITEHSNQTVTEGGARKEGEPHGDKCDTDSDQIKRCIEELQRIKLEIDKRVKHAQEIRRTESDVPMHSESEPVPTSSETALKPTFSA